MDSGVNMGKILGPIVLAVVINVSPSLRLSTRVKLTPPRKKQVHFVWNLRRAVVQLLHCGLQRPAFHQVRPIRYPARGALHQKRLCSVNPDSSSSGA